MTMKSRKSIAIGLAAAITLGSGIATGTVSAAPLAGNQLAVKEAAGSDVIDVHSRRHRNGAAFAALALGVVGAVIAHQEYKRYRKRHRYDHYPYAYHSYPYHAYPRGYGRFRHQEPLPQHNPPSGCGMGKCGVM
jgi:hypothetical protein